LAVNHITLAGNSENNALKALHNIVRVNWSIPARVVLKEGRNEGRYKEEKTRNKYET
jgi:hypothetical protein